MEPTIVVGSGASGVAAASALLDAGMRVRMIDGGLRLEDDREGVVRRLASAGKRAWDPRDVEAVKAGVRASASGVDHKLAFGSDYWFRGMDRFHPVRLRNAKMYQSLAAGGLSNVWGAAMLPALERDLADWPLPFSDLAPHYDAAVAMTGLAAGHDALAERFPLHGARNTPFRFSRQAEGLLADLTRHRAELAREGILFGRARLAVRFEREEHRAGCSYCGMCLYGCPWGLIWSSRDALEVLRSRAGFEYVPGWYVERVEDAPSGVAVHVRSLADGRRDLHRGERCLLAGGVVSSTRIVLSSLDACDRPVPIRHSEHFHFPWIRLHGVPGVRSEELHTLAQLFLEMSDDEVCPRTVHMQVYTYSDLFPRIAEGTLGPVARLLAVPLDALYGRLLLVQALLHSDVSSHVVATLERGEHGALWLEGVRNRQAHRTVRRVLRKIRAQWRRVGAVPGPARVNPPGVGNHSGGSFPMSCKPKGLQSDLLGRPAGMRRVHLVDSTVLPSIPATTATLTVMANAHRIATAIAAGA